MTTWTVLDYGAGNLHSLSKALTVAGAKVQVTPRALDLADADVAVLPGVGAFGPVMDALAPAGPALRRRHAEGRPLLGICIGAQAMHAASEESPGAKGLALFPGTVRRLPATVGKVPHMGWNTLDPVPGAAALGDPLLDGVPAGSHVYYVHAYAAPLGAAAVAATRYGTVFCAALRDRATVGLQFHPEKSSAVGSRILRNAVALLEAAA